MTGKWNTTRVLILCSLISSVWGIPFLQRNSGRQDSSDEAGSDEEDQKVTTNSPNLNLNQNVTDQDLTNKATQFLTNYFSNHGTEIPFHIPTNQNQTIVIAVVPSNTTNNNPYQNLGVGNPQIFGGGDLPPELQQQIQQQILQHQLQQQQYLQQQQLQQQAQAPSYQPPEPAGLTPLKNLVGFVSKDKLRPAKAPDATDKPNSINPPLVKQQQPVDKVELISSPGLPNSPYQTNNKFQHLIDTAAGPSGSNNNYNGVVKVASNFGPVFIESDTQPTKASGGTVFINSNTPAPPPPPPAYFVNFNTPAPPPPVTPAPPLLNQYFEQLISQQSNLQSIDDHKINQQLLQGQGAGITAVSGILGSISDGSLDGVVQNTIKWAETPAIQDTAKLATVAILHNVLQGLNPCNFLGNCRPRTDNIEEEKKVKNNVM